MNGFIDDTKSRTNAHMVKTIECSLSIDFYFRVYCGIFGEQSLSL